MLKIASIVVIVLSSLVCRGQPNHPVFNFGFEKVTPHAKLPDKWFVWGSGYNLNVDTVTRHSGNASVVITPIGEKAPNSFGCIAYAIPSNYEAQEIEVKAYLKLENVTDGAVGILARIDGPSGPLSFDNMLGKKISGSMDWTLFSVKVPFPKQARTINIGAILTGNGKLWVDDFQILLDGVDINEAPEVKRKAYKADRDKEFDNSSKVEKFILSDSKIDNLDALGKVWGYLKYYHPAVAAGEYNWDYELFRILPEIMDARNKAQRNSILDGWVRRLGNYETVDREKEPLDLIKLMPDLTWIDERELGAELTTSLNNLKSARRTNDHYYIDKTVGVGNPEFQNERSYSSMSYPDAGFRLLCLFRYWNMIAYYFPYKNLIEEDWNEILKEYIPKFINTGNELEYKLCTLSLIARIHDTHANIWGGDDEINKFRGQRYAPLEITFIEDKAVVTDYFDKSKGEMTGLEIGDVIEFINGKKVDEIIKENLALAPASNYPTQLRDIARNLLRTNNKSLDIKYSKDEKMLSARIDTFNPDEIDLYSRFQKRDTCYKMIDPGIAYIYPGSISNRYIPKIMDEVFKSEGLIIDFRCYPSDFIVFSLGEYLLPKPTAFAKFSNCSIETPGLFTLTQSLEVGKTNPDHFKGKVVIIINEVTQSSAEYHTMALRTAPGATVIGSTTAGADGNVSRIVLPGGISTMISGIGVYYPDGAETQRIGIVPDIEVKPTITGIKEKRDELLEMAIKIINGR